MITASVMKELNKTVVGNMLVYFKNICQLILNIIQETYETSTFKKLNLRGPVINGILVFWVPFFGSLSFWSSSMVLCPCFRWCHRFWGYCFFRFWFRLLALRLYIIYLFTMGSYSNCYCHGHFQLKCVYNGFRTVIRRKNLDVLALI